MRLLAFDTSSIAVSVAVLSGGDEPERRMRSDGKTQLRLRVGPRGIRQTEIAPNRHAERLVPMVHDLLDELGDTPNDIEAIAVGLGPGPFTGLRVGVITAKAIGDALGVPTYGVCSLDAIAMVSPNQGREFVVASDARRKQVYWRRYDAQRRPLGEPDICSPRELATGLSNDVAMVVGAGAELYRDEFADFELPVDDGDDDELRYPDAMNVGRLVYDRALSGQPGDDLTPLYLRRPDVQVPGKPKAVTPT